MLQRRKVQKEKFFGCKYLQRLNHDKQFLLNCVGNHELYSGNADSYFQLQNILTDALAKVNRRQKTLMRLQPMYTHKMKERSAMSAKMMENIEMKQMDKRLHVAKVAFNILRVARQAQINHNTELCLRSAYRAREFVRSQPSRLIHDKSVYIERVYNIIGDLYLGMKDFIPNWTQDENDLRILYMMGITVCNENEEEHLRRTFLPYIYDPRKLLEESEKEMALATTTLDRVFLYHEMGLSLCQLRNWEQARFMCRRCAQEARTISANVWVLNGAFMIARFETLQQNYVDARNTISEAIEIAKTFPVTTWADFLTRTMQLMDFISGLERDRNLQLFKRQKDMLDSMPSRGMKMTMSHIFNVMSRLPPAHRMMLVPGLPSSQSQPKKSKGRRSIRGLSLSAVRGNVRERRRVNRKHPEMVRSLEQRTKQTVKELDSVI